MMTTSHQPILIPLSTSRPTTPTTPFQDDGSDTPISSRQRSDTMMTTSSSSSFPHLHTPETPSILHRFDAIEDESITRWKRQGSYELGAVPGIDEGLNDERFGSENGMLRAEMEGGDEEEVERALRVISTPSGRVNHDDSDADGRRSFTSSSTPPQTYPNFILHGTVHNSTANVDGLLFPPSESAPPVNIQVTVKPELKRTKSSFKNAVRKKLDRSKSSFKAMRNRRDPLLEGDIEGPSLPKDVGSVDLGPIGTQGSKASRLRSLLSTSMSRSQSSSSARTSFSFSSNTTSTSAALPAGTPSNLSQVVLSKPSDSLVVSSNHSAMREMDDVGSRATRTEESHSSSLSARVNADDLSSAVVLPVTKGKARARSPFRKSRRPELFSSVSSGTPLTKTMPVSTVVSSRISRPRAATLPLGVGPFNLPDMRGPPTKPKIDLFGSLLPKEMKIMILRKLLELYAETGGNGKWVGEAGGWRDLIRLTRVSKSWQSLCLDGQLWPLVHLASLSPELHPATLRRILSSIQPFITSLSLRGMDNLDGSDLIASLARFNVQDGSSTFTSQLHQLTTLDLRGCKRLTSDEVVFLISGAPNLQHVNLKGVQAVSSEVVRNLARTTKSLRSLDVSRCWNITLCDLVVFLKMMTPSQAAGMKVLRLAGIKGYGTTSGEFLPLVAERLVHLDMLDLQGCTHLFDSDFQRFAEVLDSEGRVSTLKHLIISGCASLDPTTFEHLARRVPELVKLEAAGLPDAYRDRRADDQSLVNLLRSVPKLERLDLEGTGLFGGVTDRVLDILTPAKGAQGVVGRELVELHIGYAREITSEALIRLLRGCNKLLVLDADNTSANNALMREFFNRRPHTARLSLIDCRAITPAAYSSRASSTRPRAGKSGYDAVPFSYGSEEMEGKAVLKTFWSWRRVGVPKGWRDALTDADRPAVATGDQREANRGGDGGGAKRVRAEGARIRGNWWVGEPDEESGRCVIM